MQLHDDDVPDEGSPGQRFERGRSLVLGLIAIIGGGILAVAGIVSHQNPTVPIAAAAVGVVVVVVDLATRRSRRRKLGE